MISDSNIIIAPLGAQLHNLHLSVKPLSGDRSGVERGDEKSSREVVEKALSKLNEIANSQKKELNFHYDERIDKIVVRVVEVNTEKVIRQIPSEEFIRLSLKLDEIIGLLLNQNV